MVLCLMVYNPATFQAAGDFEKGNIDDGEFQALKDDIRYYFPNFRFPGRHRGSVSWSKNRAQILLCKLYLFRWFIELQSWQSYLFHGAILSSVLWTQNQLSGSYSVVWFKIVSFSSSVEVLEVGPETVVSTDLTGPENRARPEWADPPPPPHYLDLLVLLVHHPVRDNLLPSGYR